MAAASTKLAVVRLPFLLLTATLLGLAFYRTYRTPAATCDDRTCAPDANRQARRLLWIAVVIVAAIAAFPYYSECLF